MRGARAEDTDILQQAHVLFALTYEMPDGMIRSQQTDQATSQVTVESDKHG